jgi:hypothetical protein
MSHPIYNPGNVRFSLAQLAREERDRAARNPFTAGRTEQQLQNDRAEQGRAREAVRNYVNPQFAEKEMFKTKDNTEKELSGFRPGTQLYSSRRTELSEREKSSLRANPKSPFTLIKPLRPNILDAAADERQKELAEQRKMAGHKWVVVNQR